MSHLFISDIHLQSDLQDTADRFHQFFNQLPSDVDAVYILGDLFEMWIGDDDLDVFSLSIIHTIRNAVDRGVAVYVQHGNRDFFLSHQFESLSGCVLLPEEYVFTVCHKRILLMHGDTLCERDVAYQKARRWLRHPALQWIFLKFPLRLRRLIAQRMRNKSQHYTKMQLPETMDATQNAIERVMRRHQADLLIHGHTHREKMYSFLLEGKEVKRIVLPAWHDHADALLLPDDGSERWMPIF